VRPLLSLGLLVAVAGAIQLLPSNAAVGREPARVQVVEKEFSLVLSRLKVPAGTTIVEVINFGMDNHDLVLKRNAKGAKPIVFRQLAPRERVTKTLNLPAGRYTLWCSVPGHREHGMVAPLTVG
jgi:plastocyanin